MIDHELTDPAGGALTITHDHQGVWVTATEDRDKVTVGPFPVTSLTEAVTVESDAEVSGDLMDGGVTAAAIEAEVVSPERARSLVQERNEAKAEAAMCQTSLRGQIRRAEQAEDTLLMVQQQRDHLRATLATTARQRDEADKRAATASPRPLTADGVLGDADALKRGMDALTDFVAAGHDVEASQIARQGAAMVVIRAALTPLSPRPEGAEELESFLVGLDYLHDETGASRADLATLANDLAALIVEQGDES